MSDKLAVVTGTTAGIGEALTETLLKRGWDVVGIARRDPARGEAGYRHIQADLTDMSFLEHEVVPEVQGRISEAPWHRIGLVNNAALVGQLTWMQHMDAAGVLDLLAVNTAAPLRLMGACLAACPADTPLRVVNVSSGAAVEAFPGLSDYCASKAALRMTGRAMAAEAELAPRDFGVLSYEPGVVETQMQVSARAQPAERFPASAAFHHFRDAGIAVAPGDVVEPMVAFLESDRPEGFTEIRWAGNTD